MNCLFCKIISKEIPAKIVYEDSDAIAFLDIHPRSPGHTVLIPKSHAATLLELPNNMVAPFFAAAKKVDEILVKKLAPDGITIGINQGAASGQEVAHLHVHFMPRSHEDGGGAIQSVVHAADEAKQAEVEKQLLG